MDKDDFRTALLSYMEHFRTSLSTEAGDWVVKGFIDVYQNIYTISMDTKVISKVIEIMLLPALSRFASEQGYKMVLSEYQNYYPDVSLIAANGTTGNGRDAGEVITLTAWNDLPPGQKSSRLFRAKTLPGRAKPARRRPGRGLVYSGVGGGVPGGGRNWPSSAGIRPYGGW